MTYANTENRAARLIHIDLLRLLAIFLVIFNHTGNRGYILFADRYGTLVYFPYMLLSIFCKIAVPIFFMISGALLLKKDESFKQLFTKRILRMVIVLFMISIPYYIWLHPSDGMSISNFFSCIYGSSTSGTLWYLYSYIGLLLILPFLRKMVKNMNEKDFIYLFTGYLVFVGIIPCLEYYLWGGSVTLNQSFSAVLFTTQNVFYALMGYYLEHRLDHESLKTKYVCIAAIILNIFALGMTCFMTFCLQNKTGGSYDSTHIQSFFNLFICIPAITVYFVVKQMALKIKKAKLKTTIQFLGSAVFGVYLIEPIIRSLTDSLFVLLSPFVGSFAATLIWSLASLGVGILIILPFKHIPVVKKFVNRFI